MEVSQEMLQASGNAAISSAIYGSKADKADYANTMKIWAIIDKMNAKMRENPNNILNK